MMNQSNLLTRQFLHSTLMIQPFFRKILLDRLFDIFSSIQLQRVYHEDGHRTYKRAAGRERPTIRERA